MSSSLEGEKRACRFRTIAVILTSLTCLSITTYLCVLLGFENFDPFHRIADSDINPTPFFYDTLFELELDVTPTRTAVPRTPVATYTPDPSTEPLTLTADIPDIRMIAWSPDGSTIAAKADDRKLVSWEGGKRDYEWKENLIVVWDAHTGKSMYVINDVSNPSWAFDGTMLAGSAVVNPTVDWDKDKREEVNTSEDNSVLVWDASTGEILYRLEGHSAFVNDVEWSPYGFKLASASNDGFLIIWEFTLIEGGSETDNVFNITIHRLDGHQGGIVQVDWSPDGGKLLARSHNATIIVWDAASYELLYVLEPLREPIVTSDGTFFASSGSLTAAWAPDGRTIATITSLHPDDYATTGMVTIWDVQTGKAIRSFGASPGIKGGENLDWFPHGMLIATTPRSMATGPVNILVWDTSTGQPFHLFEGPSGLAAQDVEWSPDGSMLTASVGGTILIWDIASKRTLNRLNHALDPAAQPTDRVVLGWAPDSTFLATATSNTIKLWAIRKAADSYTFGAHLDRVTGASWSSDGVSVATSSWDGTVIIHDTSIRRSMQVIDVGKWVTSVRFSPNGKLLAGGLFDGSIAVWDPDTGSEISLYAGHSAAVNDVAWSGDGERLASASSDGQVVIWDIATGNTLLRLDEHDGPVTAVDWSPNTEQLASASTDHKIIIWDTDDGTPVHILSGHEGSVRDIDWSPDGMLLASASWDGSIAIWEVATGNLLIKLSEDVGRMRSVAWSPDGRTLAAGSHSGTILIWEYQSRSVICKFTPGGQGAGYPRHSDEITDLAWSPDGMRIVSTSLDGTAIVWSVDTMEACDVDFDFEDE